MKSRLRITTLLAILVSITATGQVRDIAVTGIPGVIAAGTRWTQAWGGTNNADGLIGAPDGGVFFAQEQPMQVGKLDKDDGYSVYLKDTHGAGSLSIDARGRVLAVLRTCTDPGNAGRGITAPCTEPTAIAYLTPEMKLITNSVDGKSLGRLNDLVVARDGGIYFTSGGAFHVNPAGQTVAIGSNLRTNGIMLSPDERTLYVTNGTGIVAFDVQKDGAVSNQRDFAKLEAGGNGDGMAIDAEGRVYVTTNPGVQVFGPDGKYLGLIPTPRSVISVAFSGPDKKMLYVVGSGAIVDGKEFKTLEGVRNNAKSIFKISMLAQGFKGRAK
jgi:gluconolactonase